MAYTNLQYLRAVTGGDSVSIREIIELFIEQVPEFITNLKKHLKAKDYVSLGKEAHKAKSSVMIMGMEDLGHDLKTLQLATQSGTREEMYAGQVDRFEQQCQHAVKELQEELLRLK